MEVKFQLKIARAQNKHMFKKYKCIKITDMHEVIENYVKKR